ncbi:hypothetical protein AD998_14335 [bacterium 336/3]|nr:hypothetical protein AD998_14335 [bacterium 336/3]
MTQEERQQKFNLFLEGFGMPPQIEVNYSRLKLLGLMASGIFTILFFTYSFIMFYPKLEKSLQTIMILSYVILCGVIEMVFKIYSLIKSFFDKNPILIISPDGIYTRKANFLEWNNIYSEHIEKVVKNRSNDKYYFCYNYPDGDVRLQVSGFNLDTNELKFYLEKYRQLYNIKKNTFHL